MAASSQNQRLGASVAFLCLIQLLAMIGTSLQLPHKNVGMLLNAGKYFYNYRMETNLFVIKNLMNELGFETRDLLIVRADNMICNPNGINCPSLRDRERDAERSIASSPFETDYGFRDNDPAKLLELLSGHYEPEESNYRKLERDENTNFFYYTSGHGGNLYYKIQDTEVVFAQQVHDFLGNPSYKYKQKESFLLSDSCGAGTVFSVVEGNHSTYMIGSSSWDQKAWSFDFDPIFSMPLNDRFTYHFDQLVAPQLKKGEMVSVHKLKTLIDKGMLDADYLSFNLLDRSEKQIYLNDFMAQSDPREVRTVAANSDLVQSHLRGFFDA